MMSTISEVRPELSKYAPKVKMIKINPDKIKDVIGSGGKVINQIISDCDDVKIDIEQDGRVYIMHMDMAYVDKAKNIIENLVREVEVGKVYTGKVVRVEAYGAFVELWDGCQGLCHVSKLDVKRVEKAEDVVHVGDEILVKCIGVKEGKIDLSRKDALKPLEAKAE